MRKDLWIWGYVLDEIPSRPPFVDGWSYCSLETAGEYLEAGNAFFMNSMHSREALNSTNMELMKGFNQVVCGLEHEHYTETAEMISKLSLEYPNIKGAILDDFLTPGVSSYQLQPEDLRKIKAALTSCNPDLKLYVVYYTYMDSKRIIPYLDSIDVINLWCWVSTDHFWQSEYHYYLHQMRENTGKDIVQGIFLHDFGCRFEMLDRTFPQPLDKLEMQCDLISGKLRMKWLSGWAVLQSGFFSSHAHRKQLQFLKEFFAWHYGTYTDRSGKGIR